MKRNINIRDIPEPIYYKALELKAKFHAENWVVFLEKALRIMEMHVNESGSV